MNKVIVIVGPTGVGKTKLSTILAKKLDGEIINADSTQVYKGLDIATAKVTKKEQENIPHHLFDIKNVEEDYTVYDYQKDSRSKIEEILAKNKTPIMVGGTGLYIKASLYNYDFNEEQIKYNYDSFSNDELYEKLLVIDPNTTIHKNNRKRVERALNYYEINHQVLSSKNKSERLLYDAIIIGLTLDRNILYTRINERVDQMVNNGLIEEAKHLYQSNIRTKAVLTPIGYKELFEYFDGQKELSECIELIKQKSRKYAKRQYTWFNNQMNVKWFNVNLENFDDTVNEILEYIKRY
ncbi:MAG: tRNA (adenosine(37)-N6)-dimethylallyltransferase MiaA [Ignavibacteriales bacterium]